MLRIRLLRIQHCTSTATLLVTTCASEAMLDMLECKVIGYVRPLTMLTGLYVHDVCLGLEIKLVEA